MAKYRITSIPQYSDGGMKKKKQPVVKSGWDSPVEGITSNNPLAAFMPNQPMVNQPTEYTIDPNQQDIPYNQRTGLEQLATQPEFGNEGYGYKKDLFTGEYKILPAGTPTLERDYFGKLIENVNANPYIPVDYAGKKLNCPPGSRPYKGVCLTEEEYAQVEAKEESNIQYREQVVIEEERKRQEEEQRIANQRWQDYHTKALKKGNKHVKGALDPWSTISKKDWEKNKGDEWYNDSDPNIKGSHQYYLDKKDLGNGDYEVRLYPRAAIYGLMSQYGMQPSEFEKYHGINAKNLQKEYKPVLNYLHQYYVNQGSDFIEQYTKQGYSAEEAKKKLKEEKNYGITSGINNNFKDIAESYDFQNNADKYYMDNAGVMYTKDRNDNVYMYTNDPQNENLTVISPGSTDPNENPFAPVNDKNYTKQGTWTWQPVDESKVNFGSKGELYVNGRETGLYDYNYKGRDPKKNENTIITNYKNYITKLNKDVANENKFSQEQGKYEQMNNILFDQVYGSTSQTEIPEISSVDQLNSGGINSSYVDAYNEAVRKMNALTQENIKLGSIELPIKKQKDVSNNPEYYQKEKTKILEEFNNKVSKFSFNKVGDKKVNFGALGTSYEAPFEGRNITAYKNPDKFKLQKNQTINQEAQNYLRYAFYNDILPTEKNLMNEEYRGEAEGWKAKYKNNYYAFEASPEGKKFLETYKNQPSFGQALLNEASTIKGTNVAEDQYNKQVELAKQRMQNMQENAPWYANAIDQGMALFTQPYSTINKWSESKLQAPMLGIMGDSPTTRDLEQLDQTFGTGASSVYIDNINKINQNPISQFTNLINPVYFAANAGRGLSRLKQKDPEQKLSDIGLDALFALTGAGLGRSLMGAKVLAPATKYVPQALKTGKYLPRVGNAVTNLVTPSTALNAYFANHAFVPHTDPVTGETVQGFGTQAFNNIYDAIGKDEYGELKVDWDKISPELVNAYMAYSIGKHGLSNANQFSGNLLGKPSLLNIGKLTQPIRQPLQNFKNAVINPPKIYTHPTTGKIHYVNSISDLPLMNNNRRGVNYKNGGPVLPKANRGLISRVTRSNYNPISYPIKKIGYKIAVQHAGHSRTKEEIRKGILGTSKDKYFGQVYDTKNLYGPGKRDLNKLYFFGDETGFEPINYDFSSDKGLDAMVEKYGPLKAFLLNSEIGHGEPLSAFQLNTAEKRTNGGIGLYEPLLNFDVPIIQGFGPEATPEYYLPDGSLNLDLLAKRNLSFVGREKIMESINHPELQQQAGYLKDRARARFNTLFDEAGTDVIPFEIDFAGGARPKYPLYGENPVKPIDNVAGHMGLLKRLPNGEFDFVTRDLWSFRPEAYNTKWNMQDGFKQAQTQLMDMFGKPFVLTQTNPIKFKEGGLIKARNGKPIKVKKPIEIKIPKPENIRTNINKQLAGLSFTNYLNSTAPETMRLIADLKSQGIVAPSIPEGTLVTYPNLLNLATKKGIQNALTVARYTEPSLVEGVSSSGTKTPLSNLDLKAYIDKGLLGDGPGMAMYSASHVPGMRYGRRDGLSRLPYKTMFIGNREQGTPESLDALYTFPSFSSEPEHIRKGIMSDTYGSYATLLRYPFDYSGSAMDMFNRFRNFENETAAQSQIMKQTGGREGASPGLIGGSKFSKPLEGWQKSGIDPVFFQSWMGPPETPIIGHPGQKVLEPLFTQTKPIIKEMEAEETALKKLYAEGKYEELINKLNDKIKSGDFGSPESNIEQIKIRQKEKSDVAPYIDLSKYDIYKGASKPYQSEHIDPQTGLISLEGDGLENIASDALSSYQDFMEFGPLLDAARNKSNIVRTYYSPLKFKFKKGGELPEARFGKPVKLNYERPKPSPLPLVFKDMMANTRLWPELSENAKIPDVTNNPKYSEAYKQYMDKWNSLPETGWHKRTPPYVKTIKSEIDPSLLTNDYPDSFSPIRFGDDYAFKGKEWFNVDPADYLPEDFKKIGLEDANNSLNEYFSKLSPYGSEIFKGIGDFNFKSFSDGWEVRNQMMNAFDKPQWVPSKDDFFTESELIKLVNQQSEWQKARNSFDDMYPENPAMAMFNAFGGNNSREELFSNLFPNASVPNFRSKFTTPSQEALLQQKLPWQYSVRNQGMLNPNSLENINGLGDTLPRTYRDLLKSQKDNWFATGPAKDVVMEMRGMINRTWRQLENSTPEQLEYYRQQIVKKMDKQTRDRWNRDIEKPFKGSDAWRQISSEPGYKNKMGGVSMKLSKSEIDKYVKGGYIIEEE